MIGAIVDELAPDLVARNSIGHLGAAQLLLTAGDNPDRLRSEASFAARCGTNASVAVAKAGIGSWLDFYNEERQHQSLRYRTPRQIYQAEGPWIGGRSASPTGSAFAHIPTGTTATTGLTLTRRNTEAMP